MKQSEGLKAAFAEIDKMQRTPLKVIQQSVKKSFEKYQEKRRSLTREQKLIEFLDSLESIYTRIEARNKLIDEENKKLI